MAKKELTGVWTFQNLKESFIILNDLKKYRLDKGELVFQVASDPGTVRGHLAFRSTPSKKDDPRFLLIGSVQTGNTLSFRLKGIGIKETLADGSVYELVGHLLQSEHNGEEQQDNLAGTIIEVAPQNGKLIETISFFIAFKQSFPEPRIVIPLPDQVRDMLASKHHRLHHAIWHATRNLWLNEKEMTDEKRDKIRELGWQPGGKEERPGLSASGAPLVTNGSGEDFLFMHREMIQQVNAMMVGLGHEIIKPWSTIPAPGPLVAEPDYNKLSPVLPTPGNPDGFVVPPIWFNPADETTNRRISALKTDEHYWARIRWWDREFKNPAYLRTLTLGELGSLIEFYVHNDMHMRWASVPRHPKTNGVLPWGRADEDIRDFWDDPKYDFLGEFYSSHVNPVFWRLHGWVDDRINDWYDAHEAAHPGEIIKKDVKGVKWFEKGKWVHTDSPWSGPENGHGGHHHGHKGHIGEQKYNLEKMKKVMEIIFGPSPADIGETAFTSEALQDVAAHQPGATRFSWF